MTLRNKRAISELEWLSGLLLKALNLRSCNKTFSNILIHYLKCFLRSSLLAR